MKKYSNSSSNDLYDVIADSLKSNGTNKQHSTNSNNTKLINLNLFHPSADASNPNKDNSSSTSTSYSASSSVSSDSIAENLLSEKMNKDAEEKSKEDSYEQYTNLPRDNRASSVSSKSSLTNSSSIAYSQSSITNILESFLTDTKSVSSLSNESSSSDTNNQPDNNDLHDNYDDQTSDDLSNQLYKVIDNIRHWENTNANYRFKSPLHKDKIDLLKMVLNHHVSGTKKALGINELIYNVRYDEYKKLICLQLEEIIGYFNNICDGIKDIDKDKGSKKINKEYVIYSLKYCLSYINSIINIFDTMPTRPFYDDMIYLTVKYTLITVYNRTNMSKTFIKETPLSELYKQFKWAGDKIFKLIKHLYKPCTYFNYDN